jgi:small subunit ribosomal protein S8
MSMTDPIADFLTRIRNAITARKTKVELPYSKLKLHIAELLVKEGFIAAVAENVPGKTAPGQAAATAKASAYGPQGTLVLTLRYDNRNRSSIIGLRRVSTPGRRRYVAKDAIGKVRSGLGISIITTSQGLMTDRDARKQGVGGEVLCEVW